VRAIWPGALSGFAIPTSAAERAFAARVSEPIGRELGWEEAICRQSVVTLAAELGLKGWGNHG
jgi:hypothetical protein